MKIIYVEQGSPEWLSWRKTVITATECPVILGSSPWSTPYKCWQRKLGLVEEQQSNAAMERGRLLEPEARAQFNECYQMNMVPACVESTEYPFLGASLDGLPRYLGLFESNCILEIKCGGAKLHAMAEQGIIPQNYLDQMQHQLFITKAEKCFYYSYDGKDGICIEVFPDPEFANKFIDKARKFWKCVAFFEAPELQDSDFKDMNEDANWKDLAKMYQEADSSIKALEEKKEYIRKKLIETCADHSCAGSGIKVIKSILRGRVAYDEIPEIKDVDLDKYRKASTTSWKILAEAKR